MGAGMVGESPFHGLPAMQRLRPVAAAGGNDGVVLRRPGVVRKPFRRVGKGRLGGIELAEFAQRRGGAGVAHRGIGKFVAHRLPSSQRLTPISLALGKLSVSHTGPYIGGEAFHRLQEKGLCLGKAAQLDQRAGFSDKALRALRKLLRYRFPNAQGGCPIALGDGFVGRYDALLEELHSILYFSLSPRSNVRVAALGSRAGRGPNLRGSRYR